MTKENPASKLYEILTMAKSIAGTNNATPSFKKVWAQVFNVNESNYEEIIQGIVRVQNLYRETKVLIENNKILNIDKNHTHLKVINRAVFTLNVQGNTAYLKDHLKQESLTALSYMGDLIGNIYDLPDAIVEDEKEDLTTEIDDLTQNFLNSELPPELKSVCISNLERLKKSLVHYEIFGADGIEEALAMSYGEIIINAKDVKQFKDNPDISRFYKLLERINQTISTSENVIKLTTAFQQLIS